MFYDLKTMILINSWRCFYYYSEIEDLADHGITLPPNMQGLTEEQITELKLKDEWAEKCTPQGGVRINEDKVGRRNGQGH